MRQGHFELSALYEAIDARRRELGLSWTAATREINGHFQDVPGSKPIAASTIRALRDKPIAEGDGVLQMLIWLDRTPESFVAGSKYDGERAMLHKPYDKRLRFDTRAMHQALQAQRLQRGLSWDEVAHACDVSKNTLLGLANGGRTGFPKVMRIVEWLERPLAAFTRVSDW